MVTVIASCGHTSQPILSDEWRESYPDFSDNACHNLAAISRAQSADKICYDCAYKSKESRYYHRAGYVWHNPKYYGKTH